MLIGALRIYDQVVNTTEAPYCLDEAEADAIRLATRAGLVYEITRTSDAIKPIGTVIIQVPEYGTVMRKGETLNLVVSTGREQQQIPNVIGKTVEEAREMIDRLGFSLLVMPNRELSTQPWDTVLSQDPVPGETMQNGSVIKVTLSGGNVTIPNFVNMMRDDALAMIQQLNLTAHEVQVQQLALKESAQFDRVTAQLITSDDKKTTYSPGDQVMQKSTLVVLSVVISSEDADQTAPDASGAPEQEAGSQ